MKYEKKCPKCGVIFFAGQYRKFCKTCSKEESNKKLIEKYGSLENYYKQRTQLGIQKKIEKYGSLKEAYKIATEKGLKTKANWTKEEWEVVNNKINKTKSERTEEQKQFSREKRHQTVIEKYGSESELAKSNMQKTKERLGQEQFQLSQLEKNKKISESLRSRTDEEKEQAKNKAHLTIIERYGSEKAFNDFISKRREDTNIKRFGVKNVYQNDEIKLKCKKTKKERYGDENYNNREKYVKTCLEKYGTYGVVHKCPKYRLNNINFDSSWEVAYYLWLVDQKIEFKFKPDPIKYTDKNGKVHYYYPDFYTDHYIEIKGDHLYRNGFLTSPSGRLIHYAKTLCYRENNVEILTWKDIEPIMEYIVDKYGENYIRSLKVVK